MNRPRPNVFISYARADVQLAQAFKSELGDSCDVFIDLDIPVSRDWADRLESALEAADIFLVLLTPNSVDRDMVLAEIETAWRRHREHGKPLIFAVRVNRQDLGLRLAGYLSRFQSAFWESEADTRSIASDVAALVGPEPGPARQADQTEGAPGAATEQIFLDRGFEVSARQSARERGVTIVIKGPRQVGKTRLLECVTQAAAENGKHVASLDFQYLDTDALGSAETLFRQFSEMLAEALGLEARFGEYRRDGLPHSQNCSTYVEKYVLASLPGSVLLAIDEADRLIEPAPGGASFRADFFRMLRKWHQMRKPHSDTPWNRLDMVLVTSTEPYLLIPDTFNSPFNVGQKYEFVPSDFSIDEVSELNRRYGGGFADTTRLYELLAGHPSLTQEALFMVRTGQFTEESLFRRAADDDGPFSSHLRYYMFRLNRAPALLAAFCKLIRYKVQPEIDETYRLSGAGLIRERDALAVPRCKLYADFFRKRLKC